MRPSRALLTAIGGAAVALTLVGVAAAVSHETKLRGSVGPGFEIGVRGTDGADASRVAAGAVELEVEDKASEHNFHLTGPGGVDVATTVDGVESKTFALTLVDGTYSFICDVHPLRMQGAFAVGAATSPPPPPPPPPPPAPPSPAPSPPPPAGPSAPVGATLVLTGGPGNVLSLKTKAGKAVKRLRPGSYAVTARDRSATRGLRLRGAGAARATTAAFVGTTTWKVKLRKGTLVYQVEPRGGSARGTVAVG